MARVMISVHIESHDTAEAADIMARLKGIKCDPQPDYAQIKERAYMEALAGSPVKPPSDVVPGTSVVERMDDALADAAEAVQQAEDPQPEAQRRTRRTKAQIEADNAAAAQGTDQSGAHAPQDLLGAAAGPTVTTDASPSDLAAVMGAAETTATDGVVTIDTVKAAISQAMGKEGQSPKTVMTALQGALGDHAKSAGSLKPEEYPAAMVVLNKIIAG